MQLTSDISPTYMGMKVKVIEQPKPSKKRPMYIWMISLALPIKIHPTSKGNVLNKSNLLRPSLK